MSVDNPSVLLQNSFCVETPEGITLTYQPAGFTVRSLAFSVDLCIRVAFLFILMMLSSPLGDFGSGLFLIGFFAISWFYAIFFEQCFKGQTPGKKLFSLQVINSDGTNIHFGSSLIRNLFRVIDAMPGFYMFGLISMIVNTKFKRIGDIIADTVVVYTPNPQSFILPPGKQEIPTIKLSIDQQQAIIGFAQRYHTLSQGRRAELASMLLPGHQRTVEQTIINWAYYLCGIPASPDTLDSIQ